MSDPADTALGLKLIKAALADPLLAEPGFESSRVFALVSVLLSSPSAPRKDLMKSIKSTYLFHVTNSEGHEVGWFVDLKNLKLTAKSVVKLQAGVKAPSKPDVVISLADKDLVGLATGRLNPQKLFAAQRIKVRGNIDKALLVEKIITQERKKLEGLGQPEVIVGAEKKEKGRWFAITNKRSKL